MKDGPGNRIRTCDHQLPKLALYQTELRPGIPSTGTATSQHTGSLVFAGGARPGIRTQLSLPKEIEGMAAWERLELSRLQINSLSLHHLSFQAMSHEEVMVGMAGLEPATSWSRTRRATNCATFRD